MGKTVIGYVGSILDYEGLELLIDAAAELDAIGADVIAVSDVSGGVYDEGGLDIQSLLRFAEQTRRPTVPESALGAVHDLWREYSTSSSKLRLRHETRCVRAVVDKSALASEPDPPDAILLSLD